MKTAKVPINVGFDSSTGCMVDLDIKGVSDETVTNRRRTWPNVVLKFWLVKVFGVSENLSLCETILIC